MQTFSGIFRLKETRTKTCLGLTLFPGQDAFLCPREGLSVVSVSPLLTTHCSSGPQTGLRLRCCAEDALAQVSFTSVSPIQGHVAVFILLDALTAAMK